MKRLFPLIISLIFVWNCSSSLPEWFQKRDEYYPQDKYIVSEGWGETPERSIEKAAVNMAQIFNTKVTVEKNLLERYESMSNMKDFDEYFYEFSEETAKLISEQNLVNIMFVEPAYDKRSKSYFTLGYIEKSSTARILMDRMKREQDNMEYYVRMGYNNQDPVISYHYFTASWLAGSKNKMMQEQLDVLIPGLGVPPIYTYAELGTFKEKAAEKISFSVSVEGDSNNRIEQAVKKIVNEAGFKVIEHDAVLDININVQIKKIDIDQDPLVFVSWEFQLKMNNGFNETSLTLMKDGREGSTNTENAVRHAYESMQSFIETDLRKKLTDYFDLVKS